MRLRALVILCGFATLTALADSDSGLWLGTDFSKDFGKQWSVNANAGFRAAENWKRESRWDFGLGVDYKPVKFLKLGAGYDFITDRKPREATEHFNKSGVLNGYNVSEPYWRNKHRAYFDITGKVKLGRFTFSLRERYQYTHLMADSTLRNKYRGSLVGVVGYTGPQYNGYMFDSQDWDYKNAKDRHSLRSRLAIKYNIRHCPLTPGVSYEVFNDLGNKMHLDKQRVTVGLDWNVTKHATISAAYVYQHGNGDEDETSENMHVLDVGFSFTF